MTIKQEFINFIDDLMKNSPDITSTMSDGVKEYLNILKNKENNDKPLFTENGKLILKFLQDNKEKTMWKARDIGEGLCVSSRTVSGAIRKLITDGYVEKVSQDPVVYTITEKGINVTID